MSECFETAASNSRMEDFETKLAKATDPASRDLLGAIALVVNNDGVQYHHASGHQDLTENAPPINTDSTFMIASAGKITHIAALQCVGRGLITLDESVHSILPELNNVGVLSKNEGPDASTTPYLLKTTSQRVTVRHLLSHSSGMDYESNPWVQKWRAHTGEAPKDYHPGIVPDLQSYSTPLLYEPGEGWMYGASVEWTQALMSRLTGVGLGKYVQEHIFDPLSMSSSTYFPQDNPEICSKLLQMVRRDGDKILTVDFPIGQMGLVCNASDISKLFIDLISPSSKLLRKDLQDLLFTSQFAPSSAARAAIRRDTEMYAIPAGIRHTVTEAPVNHSLGALVIEEAISLSGMPAGTVTWNGMPNLIGLSIRRRD